MRILRVFGWGLMIIGIVFLILGTIECITSFQKREERIYTTATIVNIEEYKTGDPDNPKGHRVYVEFEVNDEKIVIYDNGVQLDWYYNTIAEAKQKAEPIILEAIKQYEKENQPQLLLEI